MAKKEVKTDLWVARQLDDSKIKYDAQGSDVKEINDALQSASKRGTGNAGYPEYVAVVKDFVIVIEDKADLTKHQKLSNTGILSIDQKDIADYAVNGAYFYAKHIAQNSSFHKIFAIGVSGDEKHHKITPLYVDDRDGYKQLPDIESFTSFTAVNIDEYYTRYVLAEKTDVEKTTEEILKDAAELHEYLRTYGSLKDQDKPLVVSGILLALDDKFFKPDDLLGDETTTDGQLIYDAIQRRLKASNVGPDAKRDKLMSEFSIIRTSARLNEVDAKLGKTPLKFYTEFLKKNVFDNIKYRSSSEDFITEVAYTLGHRYKENGIQYLYHDDVLKLFCLLLDNAKFRRVFADKYPLILIDEYQDSYKPIIDRFVDYFIAKGIGPQFGFFGDAWQTIYQSNKACGAIEHDNIDVIKKSSNFRSSPRIVQLLNDIRPDLPQKSAIDDFEGEVFVITCEDYTGPRRTDRNFKNELPPEELKSRLNKVTEKIKQETPADEELKVLMITHKVLATQQGYEKLLDILNDGLRDKEDPFLLFFMETVEPIYHALNTSDMQLLFDTLGIKRYPITKKAEKNKWKELQRQLDEVRKKRAIDVFEIINRTKLIPIPPKLDGWYHLYQNTPETIYASNTSIEAFLNLDYAQFIAVKDFLHPEAQYSTEHGVKGEEYDNVIFVISKGWNQYQFETYAPMITKKAVIPSGKQASFERNRNLFYVCCSRPKKRLIFFVTVPIDSTFKSFLVELVGERNIFTFSQYIERKIN